MHGPRIRSPVVVRERAKRFRDLVEFGGAPMFGASVERLMLGQVEELWDVAAIAMYPSRAAMAEMMRSPKMQEIGVHRTAGLAGQLNIETFGARGAWLGDEGI